MLGEKHSMRNLAVSSCRAHLIAGHDVSTLDAILREVSLHGIL
jgi:hypothetical protein